MEKDITEEFIKAAKKDIPELKDVFSKIKVVAQDQFVVVRVLGQNTLSKLKESEEDITKVISNIVPNPSVLFSLVENNSPRAKVFTKKRQSYTFTNFIVSDTNRTAFNAMRDVSEEPTGQPIVIFGPPSVGKTHLLKALQYKVKKDGKHSIILLNMKKIVNDIFYHIQNKTFEQYYRDLTSYDYLLIDDLQKAGEMTSGKGIDKIDSFLFDIYEDFFEKDGKQLVFTCDRSPMALPFSDRVRSRLFSGFAYQIEPPDEKLKRVYIERVLIKYEPLTITDSIKEAIIENSVNFRQIEELVRFAIEKYADTGDDEYVINLVTMAAKTKRKKHALLTPNDVIEGVCKLMGVEKKDVVTEKTIRDKRVLRAVYIITYILVKELQISQAKVAAILKKKSPMTVNRHLKKAEALRIDDMDFLVELNEITSTILG